MRFACGFDHAGVMLRERALEALREAGHEAVDYGIADDYPDIALTIARAVLAGEAERGVLICGSGARAVTKDAKG